MSLAQPWLRWDRLMRASHLYTGLFLVPWMVVYAVSSLLHQSRHMVQRSA